MKLAMVLAYVVVRVVVFAVVGTLFVACLPFALAIDAWRAEE